MAYEDRSKAGHPLEVFGIAGALHGDLRGGRLALGKVETGQHSWVDASDRDSCHIVWIQFHEDLLATLGIPRGSDT